MTTTTSITATAADRRGMTLRELAEFVERAQRDGADPDQVVRSMATFRQSIKSLRVEA